ncbi:hypothetical protein LOK49_LG02G00438 [Camellia lanceoleosa]|uniref:Uncharacterized protein n=1 Tax=Camellia lanceoleosa TaxID=1840588 RepID=A0ACC0IRJ0_9ERIC|nr:hypothetical protein LOK49_LG02G00438 [Camellia lanceoleosa]
MTTVSLIAGKGVRGRGGEDLGSRFWSHLHFGNEFLASDSPISLFRNLNGIWWRDLGGSRIRRGCKFCVVAKVRKGKKHDYPWPDDIDPNTSAPLTYLSYFKPMSEKPKPVTLAFEKPLVDLEKKIIEVHRMADETGLDFSDQISALENKYQQALKDLYMHLTPIQRLNIARHPNRPTVLDHIFNITEKGEAIAHNLRTMFGLKVPIVTVVTGEGGSGGALAIACANKLFMLENAAFYVASPEACAAILWKSSQAAPKAAEKLKITAQEHYRLRIADGIIPEPLGGAHADPVWASQQIKHTITQAMEELTKMDKEELLHRMLKFRSIGVGGFQEGMPVDPKRKRSMKPSDINTTTDDIESDLENLKKKILEAKGPSDPITIQTIEKLKQDLDQELYKAFISMGLQDKIEALKLELSKAPDRPTNHPLNRDLKEKADKIMLEFKQNLSRPGAYLGLKQKLDKLNMVSRLIDMKEKSEKLKEEINQRIPADIKAKKELLKKARERLSKGDPLDSELAEEVEKAKKELEEVLKSADLEIVGVIRRKVFCTS